MKKKKMIEKIKEVISNYGSTSSFEMELDSSPCISSIGNGKNNVSQLAEVYHSDYVTAITYHDDLEIGEEHIPYEDLKKEIVEEIYNIVLTYEQNQSGEEF